jgi:hypothetical protein
MEDLTLFHLPLTEHHVTAIGYVTAHFSLLEHDVNVLIADLLRLQSSEDMIALTAHLSFANKLHLLGTLGGFRFKEEDELGKLLTKMIEDMVKTNDKRNQIVHARWFYYSPSENKSGVLRQTARGRIKTSVEGFTPEQIMDVSKTILEQHGKVQQFLLKKNSSLHCCPR